METLAWTVLGIRLDRWQRRALNRALAVDESGKLVHRHYLISTARQNGKTALVRALVAWALLFIDGPEWRSILGLAHDRGQAMLPYKAILADLATTARRMGPPARGGLALTRYLGIRSGVAGIHREYHVASREARDAVRGGSHDLVLFDEVRTQKDEETWSAVGPTTLARPEPLILATSTAGNTRSILLRSWWERGIRIIEGAEPAEGFGMTWYAPPDGADPEDVRTWRYANPSLGAGRLTEAALRERLRSMTASTFASEHLNLWSDTADEWLPPGVWAMHERPAPDLRGRPTILAVEAAPTWRRATVVVAVLLADSVWCGVAADMAAEDRRQATLAPADIVAALPDLVKAWRPSAVAYHGASSAGAHVEAWARANDVPTVSLQARDLRSASALLRGELLGGRLHHAPDPLLALQARRAAPSAPIESGDWYLSLRESSGEIDAIRAVAWATFAILRPEAPRVPVQVFM